MIFSRELAFVTLGVMTMYRATGADEYRGRLSRLCDILLDFEMRFDDPNGLPVSGFLMRKDSPRAAYVDCHSAVLLALTQAARYVADPRLAPPSRAASPATAWKPADFRAGSLIRSKP